MPKHEQCTSLTCRAHGEQNRRLEQARGIAVSLESELAWVRAEVHDLTGRLLRELDGLAEVFAETDTGSAFVVAARTVRRLFDVQVVPPVEEPVGEEGSSPCGAQFPGQELHCELPQGHTTAHQRGTLCWSERGSWRVREWQS